MNAFEIIITVFVVCGILYKFHTSAEERGIDLFGGLYRLVRGCLLLLAYPVLVIIERVRNR